MTVQEAIYVIEKNQSVPKSEVSKEAYSMAISALEKQIPKKPINNGIGGYICPHCKGAIMDLPHELYHRDCGGRLG